MRFRVFAAAALFLTCSALHADTLASLISSKTLNVSPGYVGQSFTVGGTGMYSNIVFNFFSGTLAPYAVGTGYLFSEDYIGTPAGLGSSVEGYLGSANAAGGFYNFGSSVALTAGNQYFFFEDFLIPAFSISGNGQYADGSISIADSRSSDFMSDPSTSANFTASGDAVTAVTPEPSSFLLLGTGLLGAAGVLKRRFA